MGEWKEERMGMPTRDCCNRDFALDAEGAPVEWQRRSCILPTSFAIVKVNPSWLMYLGLQYHDPFCYTINEEDLETPSSMFDDKAGFPPLTSQLLGSSARQSLDALEWSSKT